jgi:hypothetical protein
MAKVQVLTITFTDGSRQQHRDCVISVQDDVLTVMQWRSHFPWSTPETIANYPLVNIHEYHFDSAKA